MASALLIQTPMVQTYVADKVLSMLTKNIDGEVTCERIHLKPFTHLVIKNIVITDKSPAANPSDSTAARIDTLFSARYLIADFSLRSLTQNEGIHLNEVKLENGRLNLVLEDSSQPDDKLGNNLTRIFRLDDLKKKEKTDKEIFLIKRVNIDGFTYTMKNYSSEPINYYGGGINWNDLDVSDIDLRALDLRFKGGIMSGEVTSLDFTEKSGYVCSSLTGSARVGNGLTDIRNLRLKDLWSEINLPEARLIYNNVKDFSDYIHKVRMEAEFSSSSIDFESISYFAPQLKGNRLVVEATQGRFEGTVDDFAVKGLKVKMKGGSFQGTVSGRMTGIPEVMTTRINAEVKDFTLTTRGLSTFVSHWMDEGELDLSDLAGEETFKVRAKVGGTLNNMTADAEITSAIGNAKADVNLDDLLQDGKPIGISGDVRTFDLDAGKIIGNDLLGETTLTLQADALFGGDESKIKAEIKSLDIQKLHIYGYDYSNIHGEASISDKAVDGRLTCDDPNLNFMTQGRYDLSPKGNESYYDFFVVVGDADLNALKLDKRGKSKIRFRLDADFTRTASNDIFGTIAMNNLFLENRNGKYDIGTISLNSINRANTTYRMDLSSSFAEGSLIGTAPITSFIRDLNGVTLRRELPALFEGGEYQWSGNRYKLDFRFGNTQDLLAYVMPGLYIAENTTVNATLNDRGRFSAGLKSQRIAFRKQYLKDISLSLNNNEDQLNGEMTGSELKVATLTLNDNSIRLLANDNHIGLGYTYDNNSELENRGEFIIHGDLTRKEKGIDLDINILPSMLYLNSKEWRISPSRLSLNKNGVSDARVELSSNDERVSLHGGTSLHRKDTLNLDLDRFDLSIVNPLFKSELGISGIASGSVQLTSPMSSKGILIDMLCNSAAFAGEDIGELSVKSEWDEDFEQFNIAVKNDLDGRSTLDAHGKLTPRTGNLEAVARLDRVHVGYLEPLLGEVFSDLSGYVSGELRAEGPLKDLNFESRGTKLEDGHLKVNFTNVPYFVDGDFRFNDTGLYFDKIKGRDRYNGTADVYGGIKWDNFKDIVYDISIRCNEIEGIDLTDKQNEYFYGNVFGTGTVTFTGPSSNMVMDVNAATAKEGELHVPISYTATSGRTNLLKFTEIKKEEIIDPYESIAARYTSESNSESDFKANLKIAANPEVKAFIEIDKTSGHMLSGNGSGTIQMETSDDVFNITGDYIISSGSYKFVAMGFVNRDFEIQDGSTVTFNGDILESTLDIDALYKTKASIGTLIADTTSVSNRRTVECKIKITDKMLNPRLQFGIEIPELDPTIKSRVESALSTEDKVQKQFLSLLISNSFLPDEQSGIVNNSTMLYSNVSEVMASQLNNILEKLDIPVDLGLNYQPNDKGNDVFDVAVSTQMFNNRVVVNGSVGNKQYSENAQTDVVGDIDIEIKLNKPGTLRLNLFSHSADSYTNYLDNSQRNGVGLTFQSEFNTFRQFFRNIFSSRKKRQEAKQAEEEAMIDVKRVEMKITE